MTPKGAMYFVHRKIMQWADRRAGGSLPVLDLTNYSPSKLSQ